MRGSAQWRHAVLALLGLVMASRSATWAGAAELGEIRQVHIAVTSQLHGSITSRLVAPDMWPGGIAHLAQHVRCLREIWPDLILVDAGNALTGAPDAPGTADRHSLPAIVRPMETLRYDAAILGDRDLGRALEITAAVIGKTPFPWLAANVKSPALPDLSEFTVVERSGLRIGFIGLVSPSTVLGHKPGQTGPIRVEEVESVARREAIRIRDREHADLMIAVGGGAAGGDFDRDTALLMGLPPFQAAGLLADEVPELDLIIASRGRSPRKVDVARPNRSYKTPLIEPIGGSRALTMLTLDVGRTGSRWTIANLAQETL